MRTTLEAIRYLEQAVTGADWTEGIALRYGGFYGPGTSLGLDPRASRSRWSARASSRSSATAPGVWSFIHIEDAAEATLAAIERGRRGVYNVVDDEPAPVASGCRARGGARREAAAARSRCLGAARRPARSATVMMTELRGASNEKAKRELGWRPRYPSWREGFARGLG